MHGSERNGMSYNRRQQRRRRFRFGGKLSLNGILAFIMRIYLFIIQKLGQNFGGSVCVRSSI